MVEEFFQRNARPLWALKIATTLDGAMADYRGISKWITGKNARQVVMQQRNQFPAILVGCHTVFIDNPSLTIRNHQGQTIGCPKRLILDGHNRLLSKIDFLNVFTDSYSHQTIYCHGQPIPSSIQKNLATNNVTLLQLPLVAEHLSLSVLNAYLLEQGIQGIYIEAGPHLAPALLKQNRIDYLYHFRGAKIIGDRRALHFNAPYTWKQFTTTLWDGDFLQEGWLK